jgi:phosphoribosylanthranilate isomerase
VTRVKICGVTRAEDARLAADLGAAAVGFVFWPSSPRFVDPYRARDIVRALPPFVTAVGVFVDQPMAHVQSVANLVRLGAVQLHGGETRELYERLPYRVIKAVPVTSAFEVESLAGVPERAMVLLDAHDPDRRGGTGRTIDWARAAEAARVRPVILSGGLTAENVGAAVDAVRPYAVDVSSGVEARPGIKDAARLRALFAAVADSRSFRL